MILFCIRPVSILMFKKMTDNTRKRHNKTHFACHPHHVMYQHASIPRLQLHNQERDLHYLQQKSRIASIHDTPGQKIYVIRQKQFYASNISAEIVLYVVAFYVILYAISVLFKNDSIKKQMCTQQITTEQHLPYDKTKSISDILDDVALKTLNQKIQYFTEGELFTEDSSSSI